MSKRITFDTPPEGLQWVDLGEDGRVIDTSKADIVDALWRGAELRNVAVGAVPEFHLVAMPEGKWAAFGGKVVSIV